MQCHWCRTFFLSLARPSVNTGVEEVALSGGSHCLMWYDNAYRFTVVHSQSCCSGISASSFMEHDFHCLPDQIFFIYFFLVISWEVIQMRYWWSPCQRHFLGYGWRPLYVCLLSFFSNPLTQFFIIRILSFKVWLAMRGCRELFQSVYMVFLPSGIVIEISSFLSHSMFLPFSLHTSSICSFLPSQSNSPFFFQARLPTFFTVV